MRDDFAVFILTHGRADNVITLRSLKEANYTGKYYLVVDNQDSDVDKYISKYGKDKVIVFDKKDVASRTDTGDNFGEMSAVIFARNACFEIAKELELKYFLELDDDYTCFSYRFIEPELNILKEIYTKQLDSVINLMLNYLEKTNALTIAFAQNGDFIGGIGSRWKKGLLRKAMNSFFCRTDRPINFAGTMNEDVSMYTSRGSRGDLILSITLFSIHQKQTQTTKGGMTDVYKNSGTYTKSFYSVMYSPSCVKISLLNTAFKRVHHKVLWNNCVPKIIDEEYRKH